MLLSRNQTRPFFYGTPARIWACTEYAPTLIPSSLSWYGFVWTNVRRTNPISCYSEDHRCGPCLVSASSARQSGILGLFGLHAKREDIWHLQLLQAARTLKAGLCSPSKRVRIRNLLASADWCSASNSLRFFRFSEFHIINPVPYYRATSANEALL